MIIKKRLTLAGLLLVTRYQVGQASVCFEEGSSAAITCFRTTLCVVKRTDACLSRSSPLPGFCFLATLVLQVYNICNNDT